jgi:REP element-mobilizing transposase RayT
MNGVKKLNWPRFETRWWQRNYYEHVIRNERDYQAIADYIYCNPQNWEKDAEYPI